MEKTFFSGNRKALRRGRSPFCFNAFRLWFLRSVIPIHFTKMAFILIVARVKRDGLLANRVLGFFNNKKIHRLTRMRLLAHAAGKNDWNNQKAKIAEHQYEFSKTSYMPPSLIMFRFNKPASWAARPQPHRSAWSG